MPVDAFEKTGDPKDAGSEFLTKEEMVALGKALKEKIAKGAKEAPKKKKK